MILKKDVAVTIISLNTKTVSVFSPQLFLQTSLVFTIYNIKWNGNSTIPGKKIRVFPVTPMTVKALITFPQ